MRSHIVPGGVFPDYELPDHTKTMQSLSELQGDDQLILTLARGHYCPKEHRQHLKLAHSIHRSLSRTRRSPRSPLTTITRSRNSARWVGAPCRSAGGGGGPKDWVATRQLSTGLSHIGLVNAAWAISEAERRKACHEH